MIKKQGLDVSVHITFHLNKACIMYDCVEATIVLEFLNLVLFVLLRLNL